MTETSESCLPDRRAGVYGGVVVRPEDDLVDRTRAGWLLQFSSRATRDSYDRDFDKWRALLERLGVGMFDADLDQVNVFKQLSIAEINPRTGEPLANATVAHRISAVSSFYDYAITKKLIKYNPTTVARPRSSVDSTTRGLTEDEAKRLLHAAKEHVIATMTLYAAAKQYRDGLSPGRAKRVGISRKHQTWMAAERDFAIVASMLCTGGRTAEIRLARVRDVRYSEGQRVVFVRRKGNREQALALGDAAEVIDRYIAVTGRTEGFLFVTSSGRPPDRAWLFRTVRRYAAAAHIPNPNELSLHALRHTYATLAIEMNVSVHDLQAAMGHANLATTMRYVHNARRLRDSPSHTVAGRLLVDLLEPDVPEQRNTD